MEFGFSLSFRAGIYGTKTGMVSRKKNLLFSACSSASIAAALRRRRKAGQKNLIFRTYSEFSCLSLCRANHKTYVLFSLVRKKVPKKYAEGVRTLLTPMGMWDGMYFFRLYEKSTKKVHRGLASPLDSRGRRKTSAPLRSAGFTAILEIPQFVETQERAVFTCSLATAG